MKKVLLISGVLLVTGIVTGITCEKKRKNTKLKIFSKDKDLAKKHGVEDLNSNGRRIFHHPV